MKRMALIQYFLLSAFLLCLLSCYGHDYKDTIFDESKIDNNIPNIDNYILSKMRLFKIEKVSISLVENGKTKYVKGYNTTPTEQFRAASITKVLIAYASLILEEEGKLDLDRPLYEYVRKEYFPAESKSRIITLRMILTHTSGMGNNSNTYDWNTYAEPGKAFHYSTSGFIYLLNVLQEIVDGKLDEFIYKRIINPLGMVNSKFETSIYKERYNLVDSGLMTTPNDLAILVNNILNPDSPYNMINRKMLTDQIQIDRHNYWGLGIGLEHGNGLDILWQTGNSQNIWHSLIYFSIKDRTGFIIMTKGKNGYKINQDIIHNAIGGSYYNYTAVLKTAMNRK
jgi:CubicO group peptidase (beta-lactamase class C family)